MKLKPRHLLLSASLLIAPSVISQSYAQSYDIYCDGYGNCRATPTMYNHKVVGLAFTKDVEPYFYKDGYSSVDPNFNDWQAEQDTMNACNKSSERAPCTFNRWVANDQCIAVARSEVESDGTPRWGVADARTCSQAKKAAVANCQKNAENPSSCKVYKSESACLRAVLRCARAHAVALASGVW